MNMAGLPGKPGPKGEQGPEGVGRPGKPVSSGCLPSGLSLPELCLLSHLHPFPCGTRGPLVSFRAGLVYLEFKGPQD